MDHSFYNVRDFGARGDGLSLDTAALQAALDACKKNGGTVAVPKGIYLTSSLRPTQSLTRAIAFIITAAASIISPVLTGRPIWTSWTRRTPPKYKCF